MFQKLIKKYLNLPIDEKLYAAEAVVFLFTARVSIAIIPFKHIAKFITAHQEKADGFNNDQNTKIVNAVKTSIQRVAPHTPWQNACLSRAIAGNLMLRRQGIPSTLCLGLSKRDSNIHSMVAHAWLDSGEITVTGKEALQKNEYTTMGQFGDTQ